MEKKPLLTAIIISALLFSAVAGTQFVSFAVANPNPFLTHIVYAGDVPPPKNAKPATISLLSPMNQSHHSTNNVKFTVNVIPSGTPLKYSTIYGAGERTTAYIHPFLREVYFKAEWQQTNTYVLKSRGYNSNLGPNKTISLSLTEIPEGNHNIIVYAVEWRPYRTLNTSKYGLGSLMYYNGFNITGYSVINFTVDTTSPKTSILSLENKTYNTPDVPLNFTVSELVSQIAYSLDGQKNVTISENTTLTNLPYGEHNVTVYATDNVGNTGASKTINFTIAEPESEHFPTPLIIAPTASVAFVGVGLLVYFKKRKR